MIKNFFKPGEFHECLQMRGNKNQSPEFSYFVMSSARTRERNREKDYAH